MTRRMRETLTFTNALPNVYRAEHGRHAFEVHAIVTPHGHTERFDALIRWRNSNRLIQKRAFAGSREARQWLDKQAANPAAFKEACL